MNKTLPSSCGFTRNYSRRNINLTQKFVKCFLLPLIYLAFLSTADAQIIFPYKNTFKTNSQTGITLGESAVLTSGNGTDPAGEGVLRLTTNEGNKRGTAYINQSFPSNRGIHAEFEYFTYGGTRADGIVFYLFNATSSFDPGQFGGALGYAQNANSAAGQGMNGALISVALDEYGNYGVATETKTGGILNTANAPITNRIDVNGIIAVRGAVGPNGERFGGGTGNDAPYLFLGGKVTQVPPTASNVRNDQVLAAADRFNVSVSGRVTNELSNGYRRVKLDIDRNANGFLVNAEVFVGELNKWVSILNNFQYTIANARIPANVRAGFASSTGGSTNFHEIRNINITPAATVLNTPTANNDVATGSANNSVVLNPLVNDNDKVNAADPTFGYAAGQYAQGTLDLDPTTAGIENTFLVSGKGTFSVTDAGVVTFVPLTNWSGIATVNYTFQDTYLKTSTVASITV
ncbi:hypothetical protein, partial [Pedobacter agri]|uniref:hypothetical protein n=1 Tax=Pedobacter agri TaxID=454586 RepID=UPI00292D624A